MKQITRFIRTRLFRNLLFWLIFGGLKYGDVHTWHDALFITLGLLLWAGLGYFNNFYLIPGFLVKRKVWAYFLVVTPLLFFYTVFYIFLLKLLIIYYPGIPIIRVSIISSPISTDLSFIAILTDDGFQTYLWTTIEWVLVFCLLWYLNDYGKKSEQIREAKKKQMEMELAFLKSQINPHFLFNTLNNLYALTLKKSDDAPETILKLSNIMRYILYESNVEYASAEREKEVMQSFIDIELLRLPASSDVQFSIIIDQSRDIPPLLWLPLLENVFKHSRTTKKTEIDYRFTIKNNHLTMYSKNNIGVNTSDGKTGGIGLTNLKKRLEILYPGKHTIEISRADNYFIIEVNIDLNER
jgi:two-component system, LytTR family, sensor kinase